MKKVLLIITSVLVMAFSLSVIPSFINYIGQTSLINYYDDQTVVFRIVLSIIEVASAFVTFGASFFALVAFALAIIAFILTLVFSKKEKGLLVPAIIALIAGACLSIGYIFIAVLSWIAWVQSIFATINNMIIYGYMGDTGAFGFFFALFVRIPILYIIRITINLAQIVPVIGLSGYTFFKCFKKCEEPKMCA